MKNILITGGSGFIGRNLSEGLEESYNIYSPKHSELDLLEYDSLSAYLNNNNIDIVIHAAVHVPAFNGAANEYLNDMKMFMNIEKLSSSLEKVLYFGSGAEYDKRFDITNVTEDEIGKSIPVSEYGLAKYTMNKIARSSENIYNLRLFGVFGKYELWNVKFLSNICCKAIFDLPITIRKDCNFNYLYIDDLVKIVKLFLKGSPEFHDYNICHDNNYLLSELADMVVKISGKKIGISFLSSEKNLDYTADNSRLKNSFPEIKIEPIKKNLIDLYKYYSDNKELIDIETLKNTR